MAVILMTEEYWKNSQFSVAQYYGGMVFNGSHYSIVNKEGIPVVELSDPGIIYNSIKECAMKIGVHPSSLSQSIKDGYRCKGEFYVLL